MLIVVLSDTHLPRGSRQLPQACNEHLAASDLIVHAGDLTSLPFLNELRSISPPVHVVAGNADEPKLQRLLPASLTFETSGATIALVHDAGPRSGREARLARRFPGTDAVSYGHTHVPQVELHGSMWVLNPGSPTERRRAPCRSMLRLEISARGEIRPELVKL